MTSTATAARIVPRPTPARPWRRAGQRQAVLLAGSIVAAGIAAWIAVATTQLRGQLGFVVAFVPVQLLLAAVAGRLSGRRTGLSDLVVPSLLGYTLAAVLLALWSVVRKVVVEGLGAWQINAFTQDGASIDVDAPLNTGGFLHAIVGTFIVVGLAAVIAVPIGILSALYITEVRGRLTPLVRFFVQAMSGVPSIIAGLFVYAALIVTGVSGFSGFMGALALAILMLPTVGRTAEEVLKLVPDDLRVASAALASTQWRATLMVVLPAARTGLITATILGVARVAGETAPLLLTSFGGNEVNLNPFSGPMPTLPSYIFRQLSLGGENDVARAWGAALTLLVIVAVLFLAARLVGGRSRR